MVDFSDSDLWLKIHDQFYVAEAIPETANQYYPLMPIVTPNIIDFHTIAVRVTISENKPNWKYGGKVFSVIPVSNTDLILTRDSKYYPLPLGQAQIINFNQVSIYYRVGVDFPKWFVDVHLEIWVYLALDTRQTIEEKLDSIKIQLDRIEQDIGTTTGQ